MLVVPPPDDIGIRYEVRNYLVGVADSSTGACMLEGDLSHSIISPIVVILGLLPGIYVIVKNPYIGTTRTFFVVMVLFLIVGVLDFSLTNASDVATATAVGRALVLKVVLIFGGVLYLSSLLPYERRRNWFRSHRLEFIIILLALGIVPASSVEVTSSMYGWGIPDSFSIGALVVIDLALMFLTLLVHSRAYRSSSDAEVRKQCVLMSIGIFFPIVYSGFLVLLEKVGAPNPPADRSRFLAHEHRLPVRHIEAQAIPHRYSGRA
ncbi:MAG: hypothetical protein ABSB83_04220 [Methanomassiliicoccales archaeon]